MSLRWRHPGAHTNPAPASPRPWTSPRLPSAASSTCCSWPTAPPVNLSGSADARGRMGKVVKFEPMTMLSALAAVTTRLGLVATATTTYNEPYTPRPPVRLARPDQRRPRRLEPRHLEQRGGGVELQPRPAFRPLPSATTARSSSPRSSPGCGTAGTTTPSSATRNPASSSIRRSCIVLNHKGKHFQVRGPLNVARSPQGRPVLVQAGASDTGRDVAARLAEMVFTAQSTFEQGKEFYSDVMARLPRFGRTPDRSRSCPASTRWSAARKPRPRRSSTSCSR